MRSCQGPKWRQSYQKSVSFFVVSERENRLSSLVAEPTVTVLFDRGDIRVGTQVVQVVVSELSSVTVDEVELVSDIAVAGRNGGLGGANVGSKRHVLLEGNDIPAGNGVFGFRNSEKGGHLEEVAWSLS